MPDIEIKKVESKKMRKDFVNLPWEAKLYENDPIWVPQLVSEQMHFIDPDKGYFFEHGDADFFIAYINGKPVGRISAHINHLHENIHDKETGFFGFFEAIDDIDVARKLLNTAESWLKAKGKSKMLGPQSLSIYDPIGFVVDGIEISPVVGLFHNAPYYIDLVEKCGLQKSVDWYCFLVDGTDPSLKPYLTDVKEHIMKSQDIEYIEITKKEIRKRSDIIKNIFNTAWQGNWGHIPFSDKQFKMLFKELKNFAIPDLAIFAEKLGESVGFILSIPDVNPALRLLNGHLYPWRIVKFLREMNKTKRIRTILMGVLPEYRGRGIDAVLVLKTIENALKLGFVDSDCSLIVETNAKMINALRPLKAKRYKTYRLYERPIR